VGKSKNEVGFPGTSGIDISQVQPGTTIATGKVRVGYQKSETLVDKLLKNSQTVVDLFGQIIKRK
jgi:hypothetical protein